MHTSILVAMAVVVAPSVLGRAPEKEPAPAHGNMLGNVISVSDADGKDLFELVLGGASLAGDKIELSGWVKPAGSLAKGEPASATVVGTLAKEPAPDYVAGRARRTAAQRGAVRAPEAAGSGTSGSDPTEEQRKAEATALAMGVTGCEVMFLTLAVPKTLASTVGGDTLQINVALAKIDNGAGVRFSKLLCNVVYATLSGGDAKAEIETLDRALASAK